MGARVASGQVLQQPVQASSEEGPPPGSVGPSLGSGTEAGLTAILGLMSKENIVDGEAGV